MNDEKEVECIKKEVEYIELKEMPIVLYVPDKTIGLRMEVAVYVNDRVRRVYKDFTPEQIREAFKLAEDYFDDPDAIFALTEKGEAHLDELVEEGYEDASY